MTEPNLEIERHRTGPVCVIDCDGEVRNSLDSLFRSAGLDVLTFSAPTDYLACQAADSAACLVFDTRLPGINGLDFQQQLVERDVRTPVILMTGQSDIAMIVRGMKAGAVNFLAKPVDPTDMLDSVAEAIECDRHRRAKREHNDRLSGLYQRLTPRERDVMGLVTAGLLNKEVGGRLGLQEITVRIHRGKLMRKMQAQSLADLVCAAETLGVRGRR